MNVGCLKVAVVVNNRNTLLVGFEEEALSRSRAAADADRSSASLSPKKARGGSPTNGRELNECRRFAHKNP